MSQNKTIADKQQLTSALLCWFHKNKRDLPWRGSYLPYEILVSELMLQQTQMHRVVEYFLRFMECFPDISSLAAAPEDAVLKCWEGLGYYSRAKNLHQTARILVREQGGRIPETRQALLALPGIGEYTAGALLSLAFEQDEPLVDANVIRVYSRLFDLDGPAAQAATRKHLWTLARELIPPGQARDFNQAIMELGALVCTKTPACNRCPLRSVCESCRLGIVAHRPLPGKKYESIPVTVVTGVLPARGHIFIQKRLDDDVWGGLWEFPGGVPEQGESLPEALVREFSEETGFAVTVGEKIHTIQHSYTKYRVTLHCYLVYLVHWSGRTNQEGPATTAADSFPEPVLTAASTSLWATHKDIDARAFPAGHRKLIDFLEQNPRYTTLLAGVAD